MVETAFPPIRVPRLRGAAGRKAARACVAARLESLGRPPDLVTDDGIDALVVAAGGSFQRLRAALSSALFLGATEEAPRIDRTIVARAVESLPADMAPAPKARRLPGTMLGRGLVIALVVETAVILTPALHWNAGKVPTKATSPAALAQSPGGAGLSPRLQGQQDTNEAAVSAGPGAGVDGGSGTPAPAASRSAGSNTPFNTGSAAGAQMAGAATPAGPTAQPQPSVLPMPEPIAVGNPPLPPSAKPLGQPGQNPVPGQIGGTTAPVLMPPAPIPFSPPQTASAGQAPAQLGHPTVAANQSEAPPGPAGAPLSQPPPPPTAALPLAMPRQAVLPEAVPTTIVLRYRAGDRWAFDKLDAVSARLHEAGYTRVYSYPWSGKLTRSPVTYFFNEDRYAAVGVEAVIAQAGLFGPASRWRALAPHLAVSHPGVAAGGMPHPPGTIEATIP